MFGPAPRIVALRIRLDQRHRRDPSRTVADTTLAQELGVDLMEVRRQLDVLANQGLTREANTFGGHSAWISPLGIMVAERLAPPALLEGGNRRMLERLQKWREHQRIALTEALEALQRAAPGEFTSAEELAAEEARGELPAPKVLEKWLESLGMPSFADQEVSRIGAVVQPLHKELLARVSVNPDEVFRLEPREFEELVSEIMESMGFGVRLTPESRDGGRDILASMPSPLGELLAIVECKRNAPDRPVDLAVVERFLHTIREKDRASCGIVATTSRFTRDSLKAAKPYQYQLLLRDFSDLKQWFNKYGKYVSDDRSGLWLPCAPSDL